MPLPKRRRPRRLPRDWTKEIADLHDYVQPAPGRHCRSKANDTPIAVTDDWPELVPVGDEELRMIEGYLRKELDRLFGPLP